jgi:ribonuclease T1
LHASRKWFNTAVLAVLVLSGVASLAGCDAGAGSDGASRARVASGAPPAATPSPSPAAAKTEGIPRAAFEVLVEIQERDGQPPPGYRGGGAFHNRGRRLPPGRYREYDIHPWARGRNRGPERIVVERRSGKAYYTADHYDSFISMN